MGSAAISSGYNSPSTVIPHRGQVSEDCAKSSPNKCRAIFHERETGSYFANDAHKLFPESAPLAFDSRTFSGNADVLARESATNDIHESIPRASVKCSHVIPDGERFDVPFVLPPHENFTTVRFDFDGADGAPAKEFSSKDAPACSCKERKFSQSLLLRNHAIRPLPLPRASYVEIPSSHHGCAKSALVFASAFVKLTFNRFARIALFLRAVNLIA